MTEPQDRERNSIQPDMTSIEGITEALAFMLDFAPDAFLALSALGIMSSVTLQGLPIDIRRQAFERFVDTLTQQYERSLTYRCSAGSVVSAASCGVNWSA